MSHQPFETWLLDENPLSPEQENALEHHLEGCAQCRRIQTGWQAAQVSLNKPPLATPAPGFSQRFYASLAERRAHKAHQLQIRWLVMTLTLGLVFTALLLGILVFSLASPADLLVRITQILTGLIGWWNQAQLVIIAALHQPAFLAIWILLSSGICLVVFGWLFTLWRISSQGVSS